MIAQMFLRREGLTGCGPAMDHLRVQRTLPDYHCPHLGALINIDDSLRCKVLGFYSSVQSSQTDVRRSHPKDDKSESESLGEITQYAAHHQVQALFIRRWT
jgi:hypothetical protein